MEPGIVIGIDASNLRQGGGRTHLIELLGAADPPSYGVERIIVWGGKGTLASLGERAWLEKAHRPQLDGSLLQRVCWQTCSLSQSARAAGCDLLFIPGGSYTGMFRPVVAMSRNMLPFEWTELRRFGFSVTSFRLLLLRFTQARSFRRADAVIFLTRYAKKRVEESIGVLTGSAAIIPHGISRRFVMEPRPQRHIEEYSLPDPYRLLYVSIVNQYKHQWHVVEAAAELRRKTGWPLALDLVGPANLAALRRLKACLRRNDPEGSWVKYHGEVDYAELHHIYARADLGIFASSCENMPNILLETMGAGLPVACSSSGPMSEILQDYGVYFDPEKPEEISEALRHLIAAPHGRAQMAARSSAVTEAYSWERCANDTFRFLVEIARQHQ